MPIPCTEFPPGMSFENISKFWFFRTEKVQFPADVRAEMLNFVCRSNTLKCAPDDCRSAKKLPDASKSCLEVFCCIFKNFDFYEIFDFSGSKKIFACEQLFLKRIDWHNESIPGQVLT